MNYKKTNKQTKQKNGSASDAHDASHKGVLSKKNHDVNKVNKK